MTMISADNIFHSCIVDGEASRYIIVSEPPLNYSEKLQSDRELVWRLEKQVVFYCPKCGVKLPSRFEIKEA